MSDRLAVMDGGRIAQVGTPTEVYEEPANAYVADFLGVSNLMEATRRELGRVPGGAGCASASSTWRPSCGATRSSGPVTLGDPPRARPGRAIRLARAEPGAGDGGAARLPRLGDPGHSSASPPGRVAPGARPERRRRRRRTARARRSRRTSRRTRCVSWPARSTEVAAEEPLSVIATAPPARPVATVSRS